MSLVTVLVVVGLGAIMMTGVAKYLSQSAQMSRNMSQVTEFAALRNTLTTFLNNQAACTNTFKSIVFPAIGGPNAGWQALTFKKPGGTSFLTQGQAYGPLKITTLRASTGTSTNGVFKVTVEVASTKAAGGAAKETFNVSVVAPNKVATNCLYQLEKGYTTVASQAFSILAAPVGTVGLLMMANDTNNTLPVWGKAVQVKVTRDASGQPNTASLNFYQNKTVVAKGTRWVMSVAGDMEGVTRTGGSTDVVTNTNSPPTCAWIYVKITKAGALVDDFPVGFVCSSWAYESRQDIFVDGLVVGQSYLIQPRLVRECSGAGNDRVVATQSVTFSIQEQIEAGT